MVRAWLVDDITLQDDLERLAPPAPNWWRLVSDDRRLMLLAARVADAQLDPPHAISPLADLFEASVEAGPDGMWRIRTADGMPVAIAAPMPGERQRAAELVTAPIEADHERVLGELLAASTDLGFTAPAEGATHLHFDAGPLRDARVFRRFVELLQPLLDQLRVAFSSNPRCRRLGPWPDELLTEVRTDGWDDRAWPDAAERLRTVGLTKYCDINLRNVVDPPRGKDTVELRTLPVHLSPGPILAAASLFSRFIAWAHGDADPPRSNDLATVVGALPLPAMTFLE